MIHVCCYVMSIVSNYAYMYSEAMCDMYHLFVSTFFNRTEAIKQTAFFVVTQRFTLSCDLQTAKSSAQFLSIYT